MKMTDAEKKAFILGMVSRNMPIIQSGTNDGFIDYLTDTVDVRLGLKQYIEDKFGNFFNFANFLEDMVELKTAINLLSRDGVTEDTSVSLFNFTDNITDSLDEDIIEVGSPFVMASDGVTLQQYKGSSPDIILPEYVKRIKAGAFAGVKDSLNSIDLVYVEQVDDNCFEDYINLTSVIISGTQRVELGNSCFNGCGKLTGKIPTNVYKFGDMCYYGCMNLTGVLDLQSQDYRINYIGSRAFQGTMFDTVKVPYMFGGYWDRAFAGMTQLSTVVLDSRIYKLSTGCFEGCTSIKDNGFTSEIVVYSSKCFGNTGLTGSIAIMNSSELSGSIEDKAFEGCQAITRLYIAGYFSYIGDYAFSGCTSIEDLTIAEGVERLGAYCFSNIKGLWSVKIPSTVHYINDGIFSGCTALQEITVPQHLSAFEDVILQGNDATIIYY